MNAFSLLIKVVVTTIAFGCEVGETKEPLPLSPRKSFEVKFPTGPNWRTLHQGPVASNDETYAVAVADIERSVQLSVVVLPVLEDKPTVEMMRDGWEKGFLKKASRKKSSKRIHMAGRDAHKVTAELDAADGTSYEVIGILIVTEGHTFILGATMRGEKAFEDPEVRAFIDSFKVRTTTASE